MKHTLIFTAFALTALASAQTKFSASYALDPFSKSKATPVVSYRLYTLTDVLDKKGFNLDLQGLTTLGSSIGVGTALTHTFNVKFKLSNEIKPNLAISVGPWVNYQPGQKLQKVHGGLFIGIGGSW
jgi:hypothetical protein